MIDISIFISKYFRLKLEENMLEEDIMFIWILP